MRRNKFSLSHYKLLTMDMGELVPLTHYEVLPGDTIQQRTACLVRVSPLLSPVMHPVRVRIHHWFVPYRLIADDWEDFITGGDDGTFTWTWPHFKKATVTEGTLHDYLGVPPASYGGGSEIYFSALPARAYALIFNEFYRDADLVTELTIDTTDGEDTTTNETLQKIAWEKDYFTASRPWEQKGTAINIDIGDEAPIFGDNMDFDNVADSANMAQVRNAAGSGGALRQLATAGTEHDPVYGLATSSGTGELKADLSQATGMTVNDLRLSLALQRYMENRAHYGSRYVEYLQAAFGVRSSDARLARPEYLGGGRQTIQFSEVLQTAEDYDAAEGVGKLYGHGISAMRTNRYRKFFEEHGLVMTMMSVQPKAIYTQGLHRGMNRQTKEDYFQKELQFIGEQAVLNEEVYTEHATPSGTFSYIPRYDEYRSHPSGIAGEYRSTLNYWHLGRVFSSDPSLNSTFVGCTPTKRVLASSGTDALYVMANHSVQARRQLTAVARPRLTL